MRHIRANTTNFLGGFLFVLGVLLLTVFVLKERFPGMNQVISGARCVFGIPAEGSKCVSDELAALRAEQKKAEEKNEELEQRLKAQKEREAELEAFGATVENFSLFENEELEFGTVVTGVQFGTVLRPEEWTRAWCYIKRSVGGLDRQITLGDQDVGSSIGWKEVGDAELRDAGLTRAQVEQAKAACHFPKMP